MFPHSQQTLKLGEETYSKVSMIAGLHLNDANIHFGTWRLTKIVVEIPEWNSKNSIPKDSIPMIFSGGNVFEGESWRLSLDSGRSGI